MDAQEQVSGIKLPTTLREKFVAWWEGYDFSGFAKRPATDMEGGGVQQGPGAAPAVNRDPHTARNGKPLWTATRIEVAEKIWGDGFTNPGGGDHIPDLVKPLGLNPAMSVLDLGAGLGGTTRTMAQRFGAWVTGLEYNPVLAAAGMQRSQKAGLAKQGPVQPYDPGSFSWPKRVDAVFSKEAFFTVENKDALVAAIVGCLKPRGQFLFTDYVIDPAAESGGDLEGWTANEPVVPHAWTVGQYSTALARGNMDIRITEDITDIHRGQILSAIQNLVGHLESVSMTKETKQAVVEEVEMWARRVAALSSGLRCYRFYSFKPADTA